MTRVQFKMLTLEEKAERKNSRKKAGRNLTIWVAGTLTRAKLRKATNRSKSRSCTDLISIDQEKYPEAGKENELPKERKKSHESTRESLNENDDKREKHRAEAMEKIRELIKTEKSYIKELEQLVKGYWKYMEMGKSSPLPEGVAPMPKDLKRGKDRIAFGNIQDLLEFHTKSILPELEKCLDDLPNLSKLFVKRKDDMKEKYGKFCINKPKSEYIINEYDAYFNLVRMALNYEKPISSQLVTPVQRVTRYNLLLSEAEKKFRKAGDTDSLAIVSEAFQIAREICDYANDMMIAGRINNFPDEITKQGLLLMKGNATCFKRRHALLKKPKPRDCMVFVFKESIVICEKVPLLFAQSLVHQVPELNYWVSFKMNKVKAFKVARGPENELYFELERNDPKGPKNAVNGAKPEENAVIVKCENEETRDLFMQSISNEISLLMNLIMKLKNPQDAVRNSASNA